jgi:membrane-bound inhibitor of C-type lysozyme
VGTYPRSITTSDINGDGKIDLVVGNLNSSNVSVLLGNGDGTFQPQRTFAVGVSPRSVHVGDVNGDGRPDLVVANYGSSGSGGSVGVLLGNGDGTFQPQQTFSGGSGPLSVAISDVNSDGRADLLVANSISRGGQLSILLGNSDGSFTGQVYSISPPEVSAIDRLNPATPSTGGTTVTYAVTFNYAVTGVDASDFQVVTSGGVIAASNVTVSGSGASYTATISAIHGVGTLQLDLIDNDSISDSLGNPLGGPGLYNGSFFGQSYTVLQALPTVLSITGTNPAEATTSASSVTYTVTFSEPVTGVDPGDFSLALNGVSATTPVVVSGSGSLYTVTINGITGDGTLGLNLVDNGSIRDALGNPLRGNGTMSFRPQQTFLVGNNPIGVVTADLNGDGRPDIIVTNLYDSSISVLLGNGNGAFQAQRTYVVSLHPVQVVAADVNGDGKPDLIVGDNGGDVSVLLGNGNGTFQPQTTLTSGLSPHSVAVADLNGDGKLDIAVADSNSSNVGVYLGNGNGTFQSPRTYSTGSLPYSVAVADINGDGRPDLLVTQSVASVVGVLLGNGNGTFSAQQTFAALGFATSLTVGDFNGDGNQDVAVTDQNSGSVGVLLGNGNGTLQAEHQFAVGSDPFFVGMADPNGDGSEDLVVTSGVNPSVLSVLAGNGDGTFQPGQTFATGSATWSAAVADCNGDGRADIIVANRNTNSIGVLLGNANGNFTGTVYTFVPLVTSINRSTPTTPVTSLGTVSYAVTFGRSVTGVAASDFRVTTTDSVVTSGALGVSGGGSSYTVTISGIHGNGSLQLELVDNDSIIDGYGTPLGGVGPGNGSFNGQTFTILQTFPTVLSINRTNPSSQTTSAGSVTYTVTFSESVSGVDASDFALALNGVTATTPVVVSGSGAVYTVTINDISGSGTLGLNLVDNGSIREENGNHLHSGSVSFSQTYIN